MRDRAFYAVVERSGASDDRSGYFPAHAPRSGPLAQLPYIEGDALALPIRTRSIDLVFLITTLEFVGDPIEALREALRVTRQGLILGVINRSSFLARKLKRTANPVWQSARFFSPRELAGLIPSESPRVEITWRTTLWPLWPAALPLPWGGFIGMAVKVLRSVSEDRLDL